MLNREESLFNKAIPFIMLGFVFVAEQTVNRFRSSVHIAGVILPSIFVILMTEANIEFNQYR